MPSRQCQRNSRRDLLKRPKKKRPTQKTAPASKKRTKTRRTEALVIPQRTTRLTTTLAIVSMIAISILEQTAILVPKDSALTSIKDLKGKQVAFPGEGSQQYPLPLKADDNPKFDASFAEKALAAK